MREYSWGNILSFPCLVSFFMSLSVCAFLLELLHGYTDWFTRVLVFLISFYILLREIGLFRKIPHADHFVLGWSVTTVG